FTYTMALPGRSIGGIHFDLHALVLATLAILLGYQLALFALFSKTFAVNEGLMPEDWRLLRFYEIIDLERGLLAGALGLVVGIALVIAPLYTGPSAAGPPDYERTLRWLLPGATITALSVQTIFSGFLISMIGLKRR